VYFKSGTTERDVETFNQTVLKNPPDERGADFKYGIGSYLRLSPSQGNGHWGFAVTFLKKATDEDREALKRTLASHPNVVRVFEDVVPSEISTIE